MGVIPLRPTPPRLTTHLPQLRGLTVRLCRADAHLWNFNYWSDEIEAKKGWVDSYGGKADGTIDDFIRRMGEFCPGRQIGGLVLNTPNLAADGWGHSAWSAEECRRASAEGGFFGCAMNVRIRHPSTPQHRRNLCTGSDD